MKTRDRASKGCLGILLALAAVGAAFQAGSGQVVYYPFDEAAGPTAADASGNAYNATHTGAVVVSAVGDVPPVPPGNQRSLIFNPGAAAYTQTPDNGAFTFTGPFTAAAWIKPTANYAANGNPNSRGAIIQKWTWMDPPQTINGYGMDRLEDGRILMFNGTPTGYVAPTSTGTTALNVWSHVAVSYDGAFNRIWINGVQDSQFAYTTNPGANTSPLRVGKDDWIRYFYGNIDEVRLFNRALSATEIAILHAGLPAPTGLAAAPSVDQITLTWNAVPGATSYDIYQSTTSGSGFALIGNTTGTSYTVTGIYYPTQYYYRIVAIGLINSGNSTEASAVPDNAAPRYNDHEEGTKDRDCGCGAVSAGAPWMLVLAAAALFSASIRRWAS
jgi:hypothetical protein